MNQKTQKILRIIKIILLVGISLGIWFLLYNYQDVYQEVFANASK